MPNGATHRPTVGSLFTGIGGLDLGFERAGFRIAWQCEIGRFCQKVLRKHWPEVRLYDDVREITRETASSPDVIIGGWPCQPFSVAGKRRGKADDRYLWPEMLRVVAELRPTWVVGENVAGFIHLGLDTALADLEAEGYEVRPLVIPACAVNAPHRRDRVFIVAHTGRIVKESQRVGRIRDGAPGESEGNGQEWQRIRLNTGNGGKVMADTEITRLEGKNAAWRTLSNGRDLQLFECDRWATESGIRRVAHGVPNRMDRLRALGNAVVPQLAEVVARAIMETYHA